jgi:hypothetical protein
MNELRQKQEIGQLQTYLQQKLVEIREIRSNKGNSKERERNLILYFTTNNIDSARIDNNKLFIKYNYKAEEEEEELNTIISNSELQKIKDYLENIPTKSITKTELESKANSDSSNPFSNENEGSNLGLYLGLGVVGIAIFILGLVIIKKYRKKY